MTRVLVGIPTYNESHNIERVTRLVDDALVANRSATSFAIANLDNNSPDGTAKIFANVTTRTPKVALATQPGVVGKGANIRLLMTHALEHGFDAAITLDADLQHVPPQWISAFTDAIDRPSPVLALPLYARPANDGSLTNHVIVPLLAAVTGHPIRQPIGGDMGFSRRFMQDVTAVDWPDTAYRFGVDLFFALFAMRHGEYTQTPLAVGKHHPWRNAAPNQVEPEFSGKFDDIVSTLLDLLTQSRPHSTGVPGVGAFPDCPPLDEATARKCDPRFMIAVAQSEHERQSREPCYQYLLGGIEGAEARPLLPDHAWAGVLSRALQAWPSEEPSAFLKALRALLYCRIATDQAEFVGLSQAEVDGRVLRVASLINIDAHSDQGTPIPGPTPKEAIA